MSHYSDLRAGLQALLALETKAPGSDASKEAPKTPITGAVDPAADTPQLEKGMEAVRDHLRRVGAALGTLGTAVVGGLSYARLNEMFPVPPAIPAWEVYLLAGLGLALSFGGLVYSGGRFFRAQRRILLTEVSDNAGGEWSRKKRLWAAWNVLFHSEAASPPPGEFVPSAIRNSLSSKERELVRRIFDDFAHGESASSLQALDLRKLRLSRIERRMLPSQNPDRHAWVKAEADYLERYESNAATGAAATVLEQRAQDVFRGWRTPLGLLVTAIGAALVWGVADYSKGQRDLIDLQANCAKAEAAGAIDACDILLNDQRRRALDRAAHKAAQTVQTQKEELGPADQKIFDAKAKCRDELSNAPPWTNASKADKAATLALCVKLVK
jgi:hypothetical protein